MARRLASVLFLIGIGFACSTANLEPQGGTGGAGGTDGLEPGPRRDTSGYEGRLAWSRAQGNAIFVWDLPSSELLYRYYVDAEEGVDSSHSPTLSANGSTLAYVKDRGRWAEESWVLVVNLWSGATQLYPSEGRVSAPSLSADGNRVAVLADRDWGPDALEVWDRAQDRKFVIETRSYNNRSPLISSDGTRVLLYGHDDDSNIEDFYLAEVKEGGDFRRLHVTHPELVLIENGSHCASDDLRWVVFMGKIGSGTRLEERVPFLLDTVHGSVERLDVLPFPDAGEPPDYVYWADLAISRDGSRLAFIRKSYSLDGTLSSQVVTVARADSGDISVARSSTTDIETVALSLDGKQVAYSHDFHELWISQIDGSDPRLISNSDDYRVVAINMTLTF